MAFMEWVSRYRKLSLQLPKAYHPMQEKNQKITRFRGFLMGKLG
jgi:hypothetical protein